MDAEADLQLENGWGRKEVLKNSLEAPSQTVIWNYSRFEHVTYSALRKSFIHCVINRMLRILRQVSKYHLSTVNL
jgi:hypothetical protein